MSARYKYAFDRNGAPLGIGDILPEARQVRAPFTCIGCDKELIPKLGARISHHFAHKHEQTCSGETYLHRLAKHAFFATYLRCLQEQHPFILARISMQRCNHFVKTLHSTCESAKVQEVDLTKFYDIVDLEGEWNGFRADVLLRSSLDPDRCLFVEFAVTHFCEFEKRKSGIRIIEIHITSEEQVTEITGARINSTLPAVRLYNFKQQRPRDWCKGDCKTLVDVMLVYPNGACRMVESEARKAMSDDHFPHGIRAIVLGPASYSLDMGELFKQAVRRAHFEGVPLRNCFVCRRHGLNDYGEEPIYCKELKKRCDSNEAATCRDYLAIKTAKEGEALDARNVQYLELRYEKWLETRKKSRDP